MVKVAPEAPSVSTGICFVLALALSEQLLLLGQRSPLGLGGVRFSGLRCCGYLEGELERQ